VIFARKIFLTAPDNTAMLTCKIALPDSRHPVIRPINKMPDFGHFNPLDGTNSVFFV